MKKILEGVRIGKKEQQEVLKRSDEFNIGIEYEFHADVDDLEKFATDEIFYDEIDDIIENSSDAIEFDHYDYFKEITDIKTPDDFLKKVSSEEKRGLIVIDFGEYFIRFDTLDESNFSEININFNGANYLIEDIDSILDGDNDSPEELSTVYKNIKSFFDAMVNFKNSAYGEELSVDRVQEIGQGDLFDSERQAIIVQNVLDEILENINEYDSEKFNVNDELFFDPELELFPFVKDLQDIASNVIEPFINGDEVDDEMAFNKLNDFLTNYNAHRIGHTRITTEMEEKFRNFYTEKYGADYYMVDMATMADYMRGIDFDKIEKEGMDQVEVITGILSLDDALNHLKHMFNLIKNTEIFNTSDYSGLHISISSNVHDLENFDFMKFIALTKYDYIDQMFEERNHVSNMMYSMETNFVGIIGDDLKDIGKTSIKDILENAYKRTLELTRTLRTKEQSINFSEFSYNNGRIELRFFGGEGYENRMEDVYNLLLRTLYIMNIAFTDAYQKEYRKAIYRWANDTIKEDLDYDLSELLYIRNLIVKLYKTGKAETLDDAIRHLKTRKILSKGIDSNLYVILNDIWEEL